MSYFTPYFVISILTGVLFFSIRIFRREIDKQVVRIPVRMDPELPPRRIQVNSQFW
jgi:hypothetical protein